MTHDERLFSPELVANNLEAGYASPRGYRLAFSGLSFNVKAGQCLAIVGESGCGKSTLAKCLVGLHRPTRGQLFIDGRSILDKCNQKFAQRHIQMVFQDPMSSFDPRQTLGAAMLEPLIIQKMFPPATWKQRCMALLTDVGVDSSCLSRYPHQLSGGQLQRIALARALVVQPSFLVADEPVSSVDVAIRAQIVSLLDKLRLRHNLGLIFIGHDLAVIRQISDVIMVIENGGIAEYGPTEAICQNPQSYYTRSLIDHIPAFFGGSGGS